VTDSSGIDYLPRFKNLLAVFKHLKQKGFKIGKTKLYEDAARGIVKVMPDGQVLETEVKAYAAKLKKIEGDLGDLDDVHRMKAEKEVTLQEIKIKRQRFEYEKERGKWIERVQFEAELAARASALDTGFRYKFRFHCRELIALVNGKPEKTAELLARLNQILDEQLNEYASVKTNHILIMEKEA